MNTQHFQDNYINLDDELLGDLDRIRLKLHNETAEMTPAQEMRYYRERLQSILRTQPQAEFTRAAPQTAS